MIISPKDDVELQTVHGWLMEESRDVRSRLLAAVEDAIRHALDSGRTLRFDLSASDVDSDERASVGTKLQYYVIEELGLRKVKPLDTRILDVDVEIKTTTVSKVMIPPEGQCEITLILKVNAAEHMFGAWLMRTHRAWLGGGLNPGQRDKKRSPLKVPEELFSLPVVPWTPLSPQPLRCLSPEQLELVLPRKTVGLRRRGLAQRLADLFGFLPDLPIPRSTIMVVGAGLDDPMRRARETKDRTWEAHGLIVLVGKWRSDRELAERVDLDISDSAWVAVSPQRFESFGVAVPTLDELERQKELG